MDGYTTPRPPLKAGDLSNFGKITRPGPAAMELGSIFASKEDGARPGDTLAGPGSNPNMFVMLGRDVETVGESSGVAGVGLKTGCTPESQPMKLKFLPQQKPVEAEGGLLRQPPFRTPSSTGRGDGLQGRHVGGN